MVDIGLGKTAGCCYCCLKSSSNGLTLLLLLLLKLLEEKKRLENVGQGTSFLSSNFSNQKKIIITRTLWPALEDASEENWKSEAPPTFNFFLLKKKFQFLAGKNSLDTKLFFFFIWSHWSGFLHWTSEINKKKIWKMRRIFIRFLFRSFGKNLF